MENAVVNKSEINIQNQLTETKSSDSMNNENVPLTVFSRNISRVSSFRSQQSYQSQRSYQSYGSYKSSSTEETDVQMLAEKDITNDEISTDYILENSKQETKDEIGHQSEDFLASDDEKDLITYPPVSLSDQFPLKLLLAKSSDNIHATCFDLDGKESLKDKTSELKCVEKDIDFMDYEHVPLTVISRNISRTSRVSSYRSNHNYQSLSTENTDIQLLAEKHIDKDENSIEYPISENTEPETTADIGQQDGDFLVSEEEKTLVDEKDAIRYSPVSLSDPLPSKPLVVPSSENIYFDDKENLVNTLQDTPTCIYKNLDEGLYPIHFSIQESSQSILELLLTQATSEQFEMIPACLQTIIECQRLMVLEGVHHTDIHELHDNTVNLLLNVFHYIYLGANESEKRLIYEYIMGRINFCVDEQEQLYESGPKFLTFGSDQPYTIYEMLETAKQESFFATDCISTLVDKEWEGSAFQKSLCSVNLACYKKKSSGSAAVCFLKYTSYKHKFLHHCLAFLFFMLLLTCYIINQRPRTQWQDIVVSIYCFAYFCQEIRIILYIYSSKSVSYMTAAKIYFVNLWNIFDILALICLFSAIIMKLDLVFYKTEANVQPYIVTIRLLLSFAYLCWGMRALRILRFFQLTGPSVSIVGSLCIKGLLPFLFFLIIALVVFGTFFYIVSRSEKSNDLDSLVQTYFRPIELTFDRNTDYDILDNCTRFGQLNLDNYRTLFPTNASLLSLISLLTNATLPANKSYTYFDFIAFLTNVTLPGNRTYKDFEFISSLTNHTCLRHRTMNRFYNQIFNHIFLFILNLILLNFLIAKFNLTVSIENDNAYLIWRRHSANILKEMRVISFLPPPFNIVNFFLIVFKCIVQCGCIRKNKKASLFWQHPIEFSKLPNSYQDFIKYQALVLRNKRHLLIETNKTYGSPYKKLEASISNKFKELRTSLCDLRSVYEKRNTELQKMRFDMTTVINFRRSSKSRIQLRHGRRVQRQTTNVEVEATSSERHTIESWEVTHYF